nr:hypothetical protein [Tanacetum cinerariifolium]
MQEAIEIATELMDKKFALSLSVKQQAKGSLRIHQETLRTNNNTQTRGRTPTEFTPQHPCRNCNKSGHYARDCRCAANTNNANNQRGTGSGQKSRCYECGVQGHFKRECPKLKNNNNQGNQSGRNNAPARVYVVGRTGTDPEANVVTEREVGYGITDAWDEIVETLQGAPVSIDTELGGYVREFETRVRQDTYEIYMRLDD